MNKFFETLKRALYGEQTANPIIEILTYIEEGSRKISTSVAQLSTNMVSLIRSGTTNSEVSEARGSHLLLNERIEALQRSIDNVKDIYNL